MAIKRHSAPGELKIRTTNATTKPGDVLTVAGFVGPVIGTGSATFDDGAEVALDTNSPAVFEIDAVSGATAVAVGGQMTYDNATQTVDDGSGDAYVVQAYASGDATAFVIFK